MTRLALAPTGLIALALLSTAPAPATAPLALRVRPVALNPADPTAVRVGSLRYRGGLALQSDAPGFGGLSDLRVLGGGSRLVAISDCGATLRGTLGYDAGGELTRVADAELAPLAAPGGRTLARGEEDAESLAIASDGAYVLGFEGRHRLWRYASGEAPLRGEPVLLDGPRVEAWFKPNQGFEGAVFLEDGRLLLVSEALARGSRYAPAWLGAPGNWENLLLPVHRREDAPDSPFRPTALALLPDGDVLVLERRYPLVAARLRRISRAALDRRADLEGTEIAYLGPPFTLDNFEGLDAAAGPDGELRVFLLSDDNDCEKWAHRHGTSIQTTLLLSFSLEDGDRAGNRTQRR